MKTYWQKRKSNKIYKMMQDIHTKIYNKKYNIELVKDQLDYTFFSDILQDCELDLQVFF